MWLSASIESSPSKAPLASQKHVCRLSREILVSVSLTWVTSGSKELLFLIASPEAMKLVIVFCVGSDGAPHLSSLKCDTRKPDKRKTFVKVQT